MMNDSNEQYLLISGYTADEGRGIFVYRFNYTSGRFNKVSESPVIESPSYLCVDSAGTFVYAVSEQEESGDIYAYSFDRYSGQLAFVNTQPVNGTSACYITVDSARQHVFVANYKSGSLSVHPVNKDGSLLALTQQMQDKGSSVDEERQEGPHVHTAVLTPDEKYLIATDLGTDQLHTYRYQPPEQRPLLPVSVTEISRGSGPRHVDFSKDGKRVYVVTELSGDVLVFEFNSGHLLQLQTITMLRADFKGKPGGGDIKVSPDGLYLYASNRGDANEIVVFSIDQQTGQLSFLQRHSCMGKSPRNLAIDPTGAYLLVANQESNSVVTFRMDKDTGRINESVYTLQTEQPSCLKFVPST